MDHFSLTGILYMFYLSFVSLLLIPFYRCVVTTCDLQFAGQTPDSQSQATTPTAQRLRELVLDHHHLRLQYDLITRQMDAAIAHSNLQLPGLKSNQVLRLNTGPPAGGGFGKSANLPSQKKEEKTSSSQVHKLRSPDGRFVAKQSAHEDDCATSLNPLKSNVAVKSAKASAKKIKDQLDSCSSAGTTVKGGFFARQTNPARSEGHCATSVKAENSKVSRKKLKASTRQGTNSVSGVVSAGQANQSLNSDISTNHSVEDAVVVEPLIDSDFTPAQPRLHAVDVDIDHYDCGDQSSHNPPLSKLDDPFSIFEISPVQVKNRHTTAFTATSSAYTLREKRRKVNFSDFECTMETTAAVSSKKKSKTACTDSIISNSGATVKQVHDSTVVEVEKSRDFNIPDPPMWSDGVVIGRGVRFKFPSATSLSNTEPEIMYVNPPSSDGTMECPENSQDLLSASLWTGDRGRVFVFC